MHKNSLIIFLVAFLLIGANSLLPLDQLDGDNDYIPDELELLLARHFYPTLYITTEDYYNYSYIYIEI